MMDPSCPSSPARRNNLFVWAGVATLVLAVLLAYANSFPGAFFFDDDAAILHNPSIRTLNSWHVLWPPVEAGIGGRPFANLTFALNYLCGGVAPAGYHAVNLAIHLAGTLVLFALARRTLLQPAMQARLGAAATGTALVIALLWGLHPVQTTVVDYMSQRTEGLMALMYLFTLYAFARSVEAADAAAASTPATGAHRAAITWGILAVVASLLGMATKEDMVTVPVLVLLWDRTFRAGTFKASLRQHGGLIGAIASTWVVLAALMLTSKLAARGVGLSLKSPVEYALTESKAILQYLHIAVWPHPLIFDYGTEFYLQTLKAAAPSLVGIAVLIALTLYALWRWPMVGFAAAWFLVLLSPSSSVIPVAQQPCAENRMYLPLVGVVALLAVSAYRAAGRRGLVGLALASVALGIATYARNPAYQSELAIWWHTVAVRPANARAQNNLGNALLKNGRQEQAKTYFETAIKLSPRYADAHNNLGVVLLNERRSAEALKEFQDAAGMKDKYADAYYNQGEALLQLGRSAEAVEALRTSLQINPNNPKAHNNLGIALLDLGKVDESIAEERRAVALDPTMPEAHYNLGNSLSRAGNTAEALAEYDTTLKINPRYARADNNAGVILLNQGKRDEARRRFEAALAIDPNYPEAKQNLELVSRPAPVVEHSGSAEDQNNRGDALLKSGRIEEAKAYFESAIKLSPRYAEAHNNLGVALLDAHQPAEALNEFRQATQMKENYEDAYYNEGEALLQLGRTADAVTPLRTALRINPDNAKAHNNLGMALLDLGQVEESVKEERRAVELNPSLPEAHYNLGNSLSRAGKVDEALAEYEATLKINPQYARAHNNAGVILLNQGKRDEARRRFEAALAIDPSYPAARKNLELTQPPPPAPGAKTTSPP